MDVVRVLSHVCDNCRPRSRSPFTDCRQGPTSERAIHDLVRPQIFGTRIVLIIALPLAA